MEYTKKMLENKLNEMSKAQKKELNKVFKANSSFSEAYFEDIEEALESNEAIENIIQSLNQFLFIDKYKYSAIFEVVNNEKLSFEQILSRVPVESIDNKKIQNLNDEKLGFMRNDNDFAIYYPIYTKFEDDNGNLIDIQNFNGMLFSFYQIDERVFVEICISSIKLMYRGDDPDYFGTMISLVKSSITRIISLKLVPLDFSDLVYSLSEDKNHPIIRGTGQNMYTKKRAQATLTSGNSIDFVIPILGELEEFMESKKIHFEANKETRLLQTELLNFIHEIKFNSHYSWINLTWGQKDLPKSRLIEIKYLFDGGYTLLSYYSHLLGREGMRYATRKLLEEFIVYQSLERIEENEFVI
nr:MAG TPA: hypothetical protein [Caudoviricetes sp.]